MKKIFAAMIVLAIFSIGAFAQHIDWQKSCLNQNAARPALPKFKPTLYDIGTSKISPDDQQAAAYADTAQDASYSMYGDVTPFVYEPNSNALIIGGNEAYLVGTQVVGYYYIKYSMDEGKSWKPIDLYNEPNFYPVWPSISVTNPTKSTDPKNFHYMMTSTLADVNNGYTWAGNMFMIVNTTSNITPFPALGPVNNQKWLMTRAAAAPIANLEAFYNVGTLANEQGYQYGYYGCSSFDMKNENWTSQNVPPQWSIENFRPSTALNSSYQDGMYIDVDKKGNAYAGVKNMFADDPDHRVPAVSKSTDGGATWVEFDKMPYSLFTNYVTVMGCNPANSWIISYEPEGFVVTGEDEYHFAVRMVLKNDDGTNKLQIVDCFKLNSTWQMRQISDFSGFDLRVIRNADITNSTANWKDSLESSRLGNELQLSKTADGQYIIAKWVDYTGDSVAVNPNITVVTTSINPSTGDVTAANVPVTIKSMDVTDVFMAYKRVTDMEWSQTINVTKDAMYDKVTNIPLIVPSLNKIPLISQRTLKTAYTDPNNPRNGYPTTVQQMLRDYRQGTYMAMVSLSTDIKQEQNVAFSVNDIYPNPSADQAEISFNLANASQVNIQMFNNLGQKVKTVLNENVGAGVNGVNIKTSDLINGSYYLRVTVDGQTVTKTLNVIR